MKNFLTFIMAFCFFVCNAYAQDAENSQVSDGSWKYAFSPEGRLNWKPEFTVRGFAGIFTSGPAVTAGIRVDDKRTLGVWMGLGDTYYDAAPADVYTMQTAAYMRRYVHIGSRDIIALYGDFVLGCEYVYHIDGGETRQIYSSETGEYYEDGGIDRSKGDIGLYAGISAGVRLRFTGNVHLFLGPTFTTKTMGLHAGIGF